MNFGFYVSHHATRIMRFLEYVSRYHEELMKKIGFIFIDNNKNEKLREVCNRFGIRLIEYDLSIQIAGNEYHMSDQLLYNLIEYKVDYLFVFGDQILRGELLNQYKNRLINFHPSILPSFKGLKAIDQALKSNALLLGNTAHILNEDIDSGPIIMHSILSRKEFKDYDDVLNMQIPMIVQLMYWIMSDRFCVINNEVHIKNANYGINKFIPNLEITVHDF
jgi:Folate-dependent phosphoribosylglycinamide formyltransferase PurN